MLVIGLGRFGAATAGQLDRLGREVLAVDENEGLVQKWSERVTHAVQDLPRQDPLDLRRDPVGSPCPPGRAPLRRPGARARSRQA